MGAKRSPPAAAGIGAAGIGAAVVIAGAAAALGSDYLLFVLALVVTQVIAALSLNLLMGYAGQISLGQAAFVGSGAYAAAYLASWKVPFPITLVAAAFAAAALAALAGSPSLRIRGLQVAATTLAFGIMAERLIFARPWATTSTSGMELPRPRVIAGDRVFFLVTLAALACVLALDAALRRSRVGRAFTAVRDREDTAAAWGVSVGTTKLLAYAVAGLYAGIAGGLHGYLIERVTPDSYSVWASLGYVAVVVIGGLGSWAGVLIAATGFAVLPELLRPAVTYAPLAGAVLLAVLPVVRPEGLGYYLARLRSVPDRASRRTDHASADLHRPRRSLPLDIPVRTLLSTHGVENSFGGLVVLRGVDVDVCRGEIVGLIGPNGAGKTTFFNVLSGLVQPTSGRIRYRGRDLLALPPHARAGLGLVRTFQNVGLCRPQTVWDNLLLGQHGLARYGIPEALVRTPAVRRAENEMVARAEAALELLHLSELAHETISSLAPGQQRLVEIAAALCAGPELLMLDEPSAGMSPAESAELGTRLLDLRRTLDLTILIIEHHIPLVAGISDYMYVLAEGRVLSQGRPTDVQRDPAVIESYLGEERKRVTVRA